MGNVGARLNINGMGWIMETCLFAESKEELQRVVDEFYCVCTRRKQKVNAGKVR